MRLLLALLIVVASAAKAHAGPDSVFALIHGDTVTIWNIDAEHYCGVQFQFNVSISYQTITVVEDDTSREHTRCVCAYDLAASLTGLAAGNYSVEVYRHYYLAYPVDTALFVGGTTFVVGPPSGGRTQQFFQSPCKDSPDVDVFPLAIGNAWTYSYHTEVQQNFMQLVTTTDDGQSVCSIVGAIHSPDSSRWLLREDRYLVHRVEIGPWDTTYAIQDSSTFELIEVLAGRHQLFVLQGDPLRHVFFFTVDFTDTTSMFRFRKVRANGTTTFQSKRPGTLPPPLFHSLFTCERGVGLQGVDYAGGAVDFSEDAHHQLLSAIITSGGNPPPEELSSALQLSQNYPNPFNPATTIRFSIPAFFSRGTMVKLKVYDALGREVATLVNEVKQPGTYTVQWDSRGRASGVYFYQLKAGSLMETKKLVLLR